MNQIKIGEFLKELRKEKGLTQEFHNPIDDFMAGALTGLGILFEFVGFYNNNHEVNLKQRKQELFRRNNL